jgi:hypothetical protein
MGTLDFHDKQIVIWPLDSSMVKDDVRHPYLGQPVKSIDRVIPRLRPPAVVSELQFAKQAFPIILKINTPVSPFIGPRDQVAESPADLRGNRPFAHLKGEKLRLIAHDCHNGVAKKLDWARKSHRKATSTREAPLDG